jgi:hypothetical protein
VQPWRSVTSTLLSCGGPGAYSAGLALVARLVGAAVLCVAGVAFGDMHVYFAWPAWHLRHWLGSGGAFGRPWSPDVACDAAAFCMAGMAFGAAWQARHSVQ